MENTSIAATLPDLNRGAFDYYYRLCKVRKYVDLHLSEPLSVQRIARVASLEPKYFSRFFREKTGVPFSVWLAGLRIECATRMLREHDCQLSEIVEAAGFGSRRSCHRWFKRLLGMSPCQYRKRVSPDGSRLARISSQVPHQSDLYEAAGGP